MEVAEGELGLDMAVWVFLNRQRKPRIGWGGVSEKWLEE
jgi:hypothetical protein